MAKKKLPENVDSPLQAIKEIYRRLYDGNHDRQSILYSNCLHPHDDDKVFTEYLEEVIVAETRRLKRDLDH